MRTEQPNGGIFILLSFVAGLLLTIIPLPGWLEPLRPEWQLLILVYWIMALPHRAGVGIAWVVGLFQDVATGALLGEHALAFAVVAYLVLTLHQRLRVYPVGQQAAAVTLLIALKLLLVMWVRGTIGQSPETWWYWAPVLTSLLLWPLVYFVLRQVRRQFRVS